MTVVETASAIPSGSNARRGAVAESAQAIANAAIANAMVVPRANVFIVPPLLIESEPTHL
jgi:hypothetical protein